MNQHFASTITIPPAVRGIMTRLSQLATVRVVGGAVRDQLLAQAGSSPADNNDEKIFYDLAIKTTPDKLKTHAEQFADWRLVLDGFSHGIIRIITNGMMVEVACLRRDVTTDGRHATVTFDGDWADDAARRDFTINALYADDNGTISDPLGARQDFSPPRLRFIGSAEKRIQEDYLRILRYYRFLATLPLGQGEGNNQEQDDEDDKMATRKIIVANKSGLQKIARERVGMELLKILSSRNATSIITMMQDDGIWQEFNIAPTMVLIKKISPAMEKTIHGWPRHRQVAFYYLLLSKNSTNHFAWPRAINNLLATYGAAEKKIDKTLDHFEFHYRHRDDAYHLLLLNQLLAGDITPDQHDQLCRARQPVFPLAKAGEELLAQGFTAQDFAATMPRLEKKWLASHGALSKDELLLDDLLLDKKITT